MAIIRSPKLRPVTYVADDGGPYPPPLPCSEARYYLRSVISGVGGERITVLLSDELPGVPGSSEEDPGPEVWRWLVDAFATEIMFASRGARVEAIVVREPEPVVARARQLGPGSPDVGRYEP